MNEDVNIPARANNTRYRRALIGVILIVVLLLSCPRAAASLGSDEQLRIGKYYVSSLTAPGLGLLLTIASCEGSVRHVTSYTIRALDLWISDPFRILTRRDYSGTDPNCLYS
jgi:hypothetical protein